MPLPALVEGSIRQHVAARLVLNAAIAAGVLSGYFLG
jgi:hypothetical protein